MHPAFFVFDGGAAATASAPGSTPASARASALAEGRPGSPAPPERPGSSGGKPSDGRGGCAPIHSRPEGRPPSPQAQKKTRAQSAPDGKNRPHQTARATGAAGAHGARQGGGAQPRSGGESGKATQTRSAAEKRPQTHTSEPGQKAPQRLMQAPRGWPAGPRGQGAGGGRPGRAAQRSTKRRHARGGRGPRGRRRQTAARYPTARGGRAPGARAHNYADAPSRRIGADPEEAAAQPGRRATRAPGGRAGEDEPEGQRSRAAPERGKPPAAAASTHLGRSRGRRRAGKDAAHQGGAGPKRTPHICGEGRRAGDARKTASQSVYLPCPRPIPHLANITPV